MSSWHLCEENSLRFVVFSLPGRADGLPHSACGLCSVIIFCGLKPFAKTSGTYAHMVATVKMGSRCMTTSASRIWIVGSEFHK